MGRVLGAYVLAIATALGCGSAHTVYGVNSVDGDQGHTPRRSVEASPDHTLCVLRNRAGAQSTAADGHDLEFFSSALAVASKVPVGTRLQCTDDGAELAYPGGLQVAYTRVRQGGRSLEDALLELTLDVEATIPERQKSTIHRFAMPNTPVGRPVYCLRARLQAPARVRLACFAALDGTAAERILQASAWTVGADEFSEHEVTTYALMRAVAIGFHRTP